MSTLVHKPGRTTPGRPPVRSRLGGDTGPDVVRELGPLALGTRLKRIGEALQAHTQEVLEGAGVPLPASHIPLLETLDRLGPLPLGQIAAAMGVSQPAVSRQVNNLVAGGWIAARVSAVDQRARDVALTPAGRRLLARARRQLWHAIESAVVEACGGRAEALLKLLAGLEQGLATQRLHDRIARSARPPGKPHAPA
jgi:DNA-binding MarR family transcriptional regulator